MKHFVQTLFHISDTYLFKHSKLYKEFFLVQLLITYRDITNNLKMITNYLHYGRMDIYTI